MVADVWDFHLLRCLQSPSFQTYNGASLNHGMGYHPGIRPIQESTSSLVVRVMLRHVSNYCPVSLLYICVGLYK